MSDVRIDRLGILIRDRRTTLLCSSLFYFRIPEGLWRDRMRKIRNAGYNCIDAYFPWNFHETSPGAWDFSSGMRDVSRFLELAAAEGLYVIARPGPYICSEWDGGGLPAWLPVQGPAVRQNDPAFLARVWEWFERIVPVIARFQLGASGTVIMVQVENELDFFDCADPAGYLAALGGMARSLGITVPVISCAGQGDFDGSWAGVSDIVPAANLYLDQTQPELEYGVAAVADGLSAQGFPLLVMETGRDAFLLRRLLSCGAKLLGAYNQAGGCDFGFTASVNNWGSPLAFQTSHYDFSSLVGAFGEVREAAWEHVALGGLLETLGPVLAGALPCRDHGIAVELEGARAPAAPQALRLFQEDGEGYAIAVHNTGDAPLHAVFSGGRPGLPARMTVGARDSAFAFIGLSLSPWGIPGTVCFSSAEPFLILEGANPLVIFQAAEAAEIRIDPGNGARTVRFDGSNTVREELPMPGGGSLSIICASRRRAAEEMPSKMRVSRKPPARGKAGRASPAAPWKLASVEPSALFPPPAPAAPGRPLFMEDNGGYRGYALYTAEMKGNGIGILLHDASDILSLYADGRYLGTRVPGGGFAWFPLPETPDPVKSLAVRAEIWGHSNFDDPRMPAMRVGSRRGFSRASVLLEKKRLYPWTTERVRPSRSGLPLLGVPGGGLTAALPAEMKSTIEVAPSAAADRFFLWAEGLECVLRVEVDGRPCGWIDRLNPVLDVSGLLQPGRTARISLAPRKWYAAESTGTVYLAQGAALSGWKISRAEEPELLASAAAAEGLARAARLPLSLPPGSVAWLAASLTEGPSPACRTLTARGSNAKASVFLNDRLVARIFLPAPERPKMAGGREEVAYLPSCWMREGTNSVRLLLESVGDENALIESLQTEIIPS